MHPFLRPFSFSRAAALCALVLPLACPAQVTFFGLGSQTQFATDVSADGHTVVGRALAAPGGTAVAVAYRWTSSGGVALLDSPTGLWFSDAAAVSNNGSVVVGNLTFQPGPGSPPGQGFRWTSGTGTQPLGASPGRSWSGVSDISGDGSVVVGFSGGNGPGLDAFRWTPGGGYQVIANGWANAASHDGSVIAGTLSTSPTGNEAFRWTEATGAVGLGSLVPGGNTLGRAISSDGSIIVGSSYAAGSYEAFMWTEATGLFGLGSLPGGQSTANAVSDDGSIVIGDTSSGALSPFIWTPTSGMRSLTDVIATDYGAADQLQGWRLVQALGMSPDGRFMVGEGLHDGHLEAWLLDRGLTPPPVEPPILPIPEPSTYAACGALLLGLAIARRRAAPRSA